MPWVFTVLLLLLLTLSETTICDDRVLSAYERKFNEIQKMSNTGYPVTRNGRIKRMKCIEEYVPLSEAESVTINKSTLKNEFVAKSALPDIKMMNGKREPDGRSKLFYPATKRKGFSPGGTSQFSDRHTKTVEDDGRDAEYADDYDYEERVGPDLDHYTGLEENIQHKGRYVGVEDITEMIEEPFIAHFQQPNRQPKRRALPPLPLTISVHKTPAIIASTKKKAPRMPSQVGTHRSPKSLGSALRPHQRSLLIHPLSLSTKTKESATSTTSLQLTSPSSLPLFSQKKNVLSSSTTSQRIKNVSTTTATSTSTKRSVKATPANCEKIKFFASTIALTNVQSWTRQNCEFLRMYAPHSSCDEIIAFVDSCYVGKD